MSFHYCLISREIGNERANRVMLIYRLPRMRRGKAVLILRVDFFAGKPGPHPTTTLNRTKIKARPESLLCIVGLRHPHRPFHLVLLEGFSKGARKAIRSTLNTNQTAPPRPTSPRENPQDLSFRRKPIQNTRSFPDWSSRSMETVLENKSRDTPTPSSGMRTSVKRSFRIGN